MPISDRIWMLRGNCLNMHPDVFFPDDPGDTKEAESVCRDCPVITECRAWARGHHVGASSVWAGKLRNEGSERDYSACGTPRGFGRHERWGEDPCGPCREAETIHRAELRAASAEHYRERKRMNRLNRKNRMNE